MNSLIQLKETTPLLLIALVLACFGLLPQMQAVVPAPGRVLSRVHDGGRVQSA